MKMTIEKAVLFFLGLTFFIGTWHALPMLSVIGDEQCFVGSVLRAMERHTIVPAVDDVPYGTLTYVLNYLLMGVVLLFALPFFRFDVAGLKMFLLQSPEYAYIVPRFLNACLAVGMLVLFHRFLTREVKDTKAKLFLLVLLFTNVITTLILHTGKMWVLSTLLVMISFRYVYDALEKGSGTTERPHRSIFLAIFFSFLALANFPLNLYSLISIPILFFFFRKKKDVCFSIGISVLVGLLAFVLVTAFNFEGIKHQVLGISTDFHTIGVTSRFDLGAILRSFSSYALKLVYLFPLTLITLLMVWKNGIRNKILFVLSLIYFFVNFTTIALVANGAYISMMDKLRYLFHLGFFLTFLLASFNISFKKKMYVIGGISLLYGLFTVYMLAVPTTYNRAYDWVKREFADSDIVIVNKAVGPMLQLPKNKSSYLLIEKESCATKCLNTLKDDLHREFKPITIDEKSIKTIDVMDLAKGKDLYFILSTATSSQDMQQVAFFGNPIDDARYYSVDFNIGNYFDMNYLRARNLGHNIYIYKYTGPRD
ncbi:MAG: hypothetical protein KIH65_000730 [Candidatus Uhrbacteria bacterium]|nr:hypothetical protein [Candidatus Uhrbacteria bacterium]